MCRQVGSVYSPGWSSERRGVLFSLLSYILSVFQCFSSCFVLQHIEEVSWVTRSVS